MINWIKKYTDHLDKKYKRTEEEIKVEDNVVTIVRGNELETVYLTGRWFILNDIMHVECLNHLDRSIFFEESAVIIDIQYSECRKSYGQ